MNRNTLFEIVEIKLDDRPWIRSFIVEHWGAELVVVHEHKYFPYKLPGFLAVDQSGTKLGLLTYNIEGSALEVVTLNSVQERRGVGTALLAAARRLAEATGCCKVWLMTTNDNIAALRFFQKRGYRLVAVHLDALEATRQIKPSLPEHGYDDIPLRDELELELPIEGA